MAMFPALHASLNVSFFPLTFISYILAIFTSLDALLMLRFRSVFPSLYSTLISSGAWVNLSEMMFLQTQAWSSCFEVFNQGSRVRWAEWEQGNARLLLVMPVTSFSPTRLWKQPWPCCISQQQFSAGEGRVEGAAGLSLSQPTAGQACRHSRAAVQTPHTLPLHKPHVRTTTKSDPWQKGPPHSSAFSHPKAGHSCSGTSQYLLVSPKSFLQTSYSYMEVHLSFKTTAVWSLHGNPDMWILHAYQEPDSSKDLHISYCYCFPSSHLLASGFSNTAQKLKA